ncbi:MAG: filamentous hemagglutinin N-terminal domain-containing protein, partial [Cyanophyceae cyanobacterium]
MPLFSLSTPPSSADVMPHSYSLIDKGCRAKRRIKHRLPQVISVAWLNVWGLGGLVVAPALAQVAPIVPDQALPTPSQVTTPRPNVIDIRGGTQAGGNLFHSFQSFTVPDAATASFLVPTDVQRVLARVSSGEPAMVNGTLRMSGAADLFLLAPGGVFFGPNAQLDVGGSFVASTADQMTFADGTAFSAIAQGSQTPLLTSTVPLGLQFGRASSQGSGIVITGKGRPDVPQTERVDGALLAAEGHTFGLLGHSVTFQGGRIGAVGGQATLAALGVGGSVTLAPNDLGWTVDRIAGPQGAIALDALSDIDVSGPGGGTIQVTAQTLELRGRSRMVADTLGNLNGRGVEITVGTLGVYDGSYVSSSTFGAGNGGSFVVTADVIDMAGPGPLQNVLLELFAQEIRNPAQSSGGLFSMSFDSGDGGNMTVTANRATLRDS